jgi:hypothetical protein
MAPTGLTMKAAPGQQTLRPRPSQRSNHSVARLEADSHRPDVQAIIREEIRRGALRVRPIPGCMNRVRIVRVLPDTAAPGHFA